MGSWIIEVRAEEKLYLINWMEMNQDKFMSPSIQNRLKNSL